MSNFTVLAIIIALALISYVMGENKVSGQSQNLHSLPRHYAIFSVICSIAPALGVFGLWFIIAPIVVTAPIYVQITNDMLSDGIPASLFMADVQRLSTGLLDGEQAGLIDLAMLGAEPNLSVLGETLKSAGLIFSADIDANVFALSQAYLERYQTAYNAVLITAVVASGSGMFLGLRQISPEFRARNQVERVIRWIFMLATGLAIITTIGIVFSMLFETINFMALHSWHDFFFGLNWAPNFHGDSELAILPLLWGTLYISLIALFVAVPIGLYAAIYLSEYASTPIRSIVKPLLEVLAGIPTIVYGLFALIVFGPFLREWFGDGGYLGVNWMADARSAATAGVVMGFMLIPFVSSLSDDTINAVPQALRDGSYGLGATQSETIKQVVFPAALPGIVGAILLAASRAIGETMIVVLGAGAIARFTANPFEALTTITTRIVSQLTGDGDFNSPETLVAFALGLCLFVITLGLNILALAIVRKYREQYE